MTITEKLLILSVVLQVGLTLVVLVVLGRSRIPLVLRGDIAIADIAVKTEAWPLRSQQISNSFNNQFQLPVLFYVGVLLALWAGGTGWLEAVLALVFVGLRIVHAAIHCTSNRVIWRFQAYATGFLVLVLFWVVLALRLLLSPTA
jgi:hypothetical protein